MFVNFEEFVSLYQKKEVTLFTQQVKNKPIVSVCVQTYNHVDYIKDCLDSLLLQETTFDFEILLGDDDSIDGTKEICIEYAKNHPEKIRLFQHNRENNIKVNNKPTGRFNYLYNLYQSQGKFIALCEGDDYWTDPLKLQKQLDFLEANSEVNICFTRANVLRNGDIALQEIPKPFNKTSFKYIKLLRHHNFIATASVMYRKPSPFTIPDWFLKVPFGDLGLYKIVTKDKSIQCIDEVMCVYRIHDNGMYSGLNQLNAKENYASFYKLILPNLTAKEKQVVDSKIKMVNYTISKLKFPKKPWLQKMYNMYLRLKV